MRALTAVAILWLGLLLAPAAVGAGDPAPDKVTTWNGFERRDFTVDGRDCLLVVPKVPATGRPWIWRTEFFGHEPQADLALLARGFHVAYIDVQNLYGAPLALDRMDRFYEQLTQSRGLSKKTVLEGFSRGGLFTLNWASRHPDRVTCIYNDAPVCDFKSWPGGRGKGKGSPDDWKRCLEAYGLSEAEALEYKLNPVDNLAPLAESKVPLLHVCGEADDVVPIDENTRLLERRYLALGGEITVIAKPGVGHHPHSLRDPTPIVAFVLRHTLAESLRSLEVLLARIGATNPQAAIDAGIFAKGLAWALRYDREFTSHDLNLLQAALTRGIERANGMSAGLKPWVGYRGNIALGYRSRVDGSIQPYGLIVPKSYDPAKPIRLDVVLHGSTRPVGMSELRFLVRFDDSSATPPDQPFIELHPLGRVENCYRWAGETDVFEAIDDVCRRYSIDRNRIVLRGMSMGASGTWHLGLKHPDYFVALGPYCGYVDTHHFSETPLPNFVKVGPLPEHQELGLHMLDSIDYAANAGVAPVVACMGEKDVFFQAHVLMGDAMRREGITLVNLISPGTGHVIDPMTHAEQMRRLGEYAAKGLNKQPRELRFVTWTLKYNRCHWLQVLGLDQHYSRAEISARLNGDLLEIAEPRNINRFAVLASQLPSVPKMARVGKDELALPTDLAKESKNLVFARGEKGWQITGEPGQALPAGKRPGLQGPIDDAFTSSFLCVRGTGTPWNAGAHAYAEASLKRFAAEWHHYFRGELPIKDDTAVTAEDVRTRNLILFGDPGSNSWIAKALPHLPLTWSQETLHMAGRDYAASNHLPALIVANPLPSGEEHYLVLNSGHTFREAELAKLNYLLFPRWGDWAILEVGTTPSLPLDEKVLRAGYFNEHWKLP